MFRIFRTCTKSWKVYRKNFNYVVKSKRVFYHFFLCKSMYLQYLNFQWWFYFFFITKENKNRNTYLKNVVLLNCWLLSQTTLVPPMSIVPLVRTAPSETKSTTTWKVSVQITAFMPPWQNTIQLTHHYCSKMQHSCKCYLLQPFAYSDGATSPPLKKPVYPETFPIRMMAYFGHTYCA